MDIARKLKVCELNNESTNSYDRKQADTEKPSAQAQVQLEVTGQAVSDGKETNLSNVL